MEDGSLKMDKKRVIWIWISNHHKQLH